jgi:hypothetical protein
VSTPIPLGAASAASSPVLLAISLIFGAGQLVVGAGLVARGLRSGRWRRLGVYVATLLGAWFCCSGAVELFVATLVTTSQVWGAPTPALLAWLRQSADTALLAATFALAVPLVLYPLWRRLRPAHLRVSRQ